MDKDSLTNYGWIVICVLIIGIILSFVTPFGNFITTATKNTVEGLLNLNYSEDETDTVETPIDFQKTLYNNDDLKDDPLLCGIGLDENSDVILEFNEDHTTAFIYLNANKDTAEIQEFSVATTNLPPTDAYKDTIKNVVFQNGITNTGPGSGSNGLFFECQKLSFVSLPESIVTISDFCFYKCLNLTDITLPQNLNTIGHGSLSYTGLKTVRIPNKTTNIETHAFFGSANLKTVYIPKSVKTINMYAFYNIADNATIYCETEAVKNLFNNKNFNNTTNIVVDASKFT